MVERGEIQLTEEEKGRGGWAVVRAANCTSVCNISKLVSAHAYIIFVGATVRHSDYGSVNLQLRGRLDQNLKYFLFDYSSIMIDLSVTHSEAAKPFLVQRRKLPVMAAEVALTS